MDDKKVMTPADAATRTDRVKPSRRARKMAGDAKDGAAVLAGVLADAGRPTRQRRRWPWLAGLLLAGVGAAMAARAMRRSRNRTTDLAEDGYVSDQLADQFDTNGITPSPRRQPANDQLHPTTRN